MTTTKSSNSRPTRPPRRFPGTKAPPVSALTVLVDTRDATAAAETFVYAVIAALGMRIIEYDAADDTQYPVHLQVSGNTVYSGDHQWQYPDHETTFERWLVTKYFPHVNNPVVWAVVQTSYDTFPILSAAMAYAQVHAEDKVLLIDADAAEALSRHILDDTNHAIDLLEFDFELPSPHIYLLNAPVWHGVTMLLHAGQANPLNSVLLTDTLQAARHHFDHTVIDCGMDLFLAQRLAAEGALVIHIDDHSRLLHVDLDTHWQVNYFRHNIPVYGTRRDFEFVVKSTRGRRSLRRWLQRGDQL